MAGVNEGETRSVDGREARWKKVLDGVLTVAAAGALLFAIVGVAASRESIEIRLGASSALGVLVGVLASVVVARGANRGVEHQLARIADALDAQIGAAGAASED